MDKLTEKIVQNKLWHWKYRQGHRFCFPNISLYYGEADFLSVSKSDFLYEYEIKLTKSDFKQDQKKFRKHYNYQKPNQTNDWVVIPNFFFYVMPRDLVSVEEIPDHAGLIYFNERINQYTNEIVLDFELIKKAPKLHKKPVTAKNIERWNYGLMFKFWDLREKLVA